MSSGFPCSAASISAPVGECSSISALVESCAALLSELAPSDVAQAIPAPRANAVMVRVSLVIMASFLGAPQGRNRASDLRAPDRNRRARRRTDCFLRSTRGKAARPTARSPERLAAPSGQQPGVPQKARARMLREPARARRASLSCPDLLGGVRTRSAGAMIAPAPWQAAAVRKQPGAHDRRLHDRTPPLSAVLVDLAVHQRMRPE